jgi:hypothetical protein
MRALIRHALVLGCTAVCLLAPRAAAAITIDQVVALAKAGVTDTVILALIDRDRTVFAIEPEQIVTLQRGGLSERVILAMLKSGREEGDQAARAEAANTSAWIMSNLATEPLSVTVGHGPDRPNTPHRDGFFSGPPLAGFGLPYASPYSEPYAAPYGGYYGGSYGGSYRKPSLGSHRSTESRALCYAQVTTPRTINQAPFVTVCPEVMQPRRLQR